MKNSFVLYTDYKDQIDKLTDEQAGQLIKAILQYVTDGTISNLDSTTDMAFGFIQKALDRDGNKYEETCEKRRQAGRKGGKASAKQKQAKQANATFAKANQADNDSDSDNDSENENDTPKGVSKKRFTPPTAEQVKEYCTERGYAVDAGRFIDFYESKGWMVGKNKMKDWRSAVRNWARSDKDRQDKAAGNKFQNFENSSYGDVDELERRLVRGG